MQDLTSGFPSFGSGRDSRIVQPMSLKVVMTLGPASAERPVIEELLATADRFRLNGSHVGGPDGLRNWLDRLREIFTDLRRSVPVILDLQGAKMRVGPIPTVSELPPAVRLVRNGRPSSSAAIIGVPHRELFDQVRTGEELSLNDGRIRLRVESVAPDEIQTRVVINGPLSSHKGINRADHPIPMRALADNDQELLEVAEQYPFIQYAFSFVHTGDEADILRKRTRRHIVAKVERPEAMPHLRAIDNQFDEVWFCRGDLGEQAGIARLGELQHDFRVALQAFDHPSYLAGQVLEHMTRFDQPTRSEVVHLWDVERAGWEGIVLSDETAVGSNPVAVAQFLESLRG